MQRFPFMALLAASLLALLTAPVAVQAQRLHTGQRPDAPPPECRQQDRPCPPPRAQDKPGPRDDRKKHRHAAPPAAPHPGEDARAGRVWTPPQGSRMARAPRGQEYRVIGDHLVLLDSHSRRIVSVVAPVRMR